MLKRLTLVALGLLLGYWIGLRHSESSPDPTPAPRRPERKDAGAAPTARHAQPQPARSPLAQALPGPAARAATRETARARNPEQSLRIVIDENLVQHWENTGQELREEAFTERTPRGWRIHFLKEQNLFTSTGLEEGDLIENEMLMESGTPQLMARVREVLTRLER